jgi:two-component system phosphate regulon sensor histidine kinase PhoR
MESGHREFDIRPVDVGAIVADAVAALEPIRERQKAEIQVDVAPDLPRIMADRGAMIDALVNLLTNACKYSGSPVKIRLSVVATAGDHLRITVSDNGSGIPQHEHKNIFQKFYRIDDRLSRAQEGSGLGLAIVKHVMRAHGGRVEVTSAVGSGSKFSLVVPTVRR